MSGAVHAIAETNVHIDVDVHHLQCKTIFKSFTSSEPASMSKKDGIMFESFEI
jgi:hypothetical protein